MVREGKPEAQRDYPHVPSTTHERRDMSRKGIAEQEFAADRLQRPLLRRSRFQRQLKHSVSPFQ
jgi:hypothetical protein